MVREKNEKKIEIEITPDEKNLSTYIEYNKKLTQKLKNRENANVTITFKKPFSLQQLNDFCTKYNVKGNIIYGRALGKNGVRVTVASKQDVKDIDLNKLNDHLGNDATFKGFYALDGVVGDADKITDIVSEENVFLADVIANFAKDEVHTQLPVEVEVQSPYWHTEA